MRSLAKLGAGWRGLGALAALVVGLGGPAAMATQGGNGGGGDKDGKGGQTREQGIYYESGEADSLPAGFTALNRALSAFQNYSLYVSPDEATARFLFDLTYGPLIELFTALSFQQQFGAPPREAQSAPPEPKAAANGTTGFLQLGKGLSVLERVHISEKLSGVLGRKDALITEQEGGLSYWIFEEDCGEGANGAGASEPAPPRIIWESGTSSNDAAKDASKAKPAAGKPAAEDCKEESIRAMERRALDFFDGEYLWLQQRFGAKDKKALERKVGVIKDKLFDELKKELKRSH